MKSECALLAFIVRVLVPSLCSKNRDNIRSTLYCGAFAELLLPWRRNSAFSVVCSRISVAVNN
jgi:hypothetical protein